MYHAESRLQQWVKSHPSANTALLLHVRRCLLVEVYVPCQLTLTGPPYTAVKEYRPVQFGAVGAPAGLADAALLLQPAHYLPACFGRSAAAVHAGPACHKL